MYKPFETIRINVLIDNHLEIIQLTALKYLSLSHTQLLSIYMCTNVPHSLYTKLSNICSH